MAVDGNSRLETPGEPAPASAAAPPRLVVAGRLILLLLAATAAVAGFVVSARDATSAASHGHYACPMHPEVTGAAPAECPICGMALTGVRAGPAAPAWRSGAAIRQQATVDAAKRRTFSQEVRASAWVPRPGVVRALLYADETGSLQPKERAIFVASSEPAASVRVHVAGLVPAHADGSSSWVDFELESGEVDLRPGAVGWLELAARPRAVLVIPSNAVLQSEAGPYVFASRDGRTFSRRPIAVGKTLFGLATVVSGLEEQERVATRNAFFLDAEGRLAAKADAPPVQH